MSTEIADLSLTLARWFCGLALVYLVLGFGFAIPFVLRGAGELDPAAREASRFFRWLILPGVVALWPLLLKKRRAETQGEQP